MTDEERDAIADELIKGVAQALTPIGKRVGIGFLIAVGRNPDRTSFASNLNFTETKEMIDSVAKTIESSEWRMREQTADIPSAN